jgi:hypothetical protein
MKHQFYIRPGNRWDLEDFEDHKDFFDLIYVIHFQGIIPRNTVIRIEDTIFLISQTVIMLEENRVLYLLREKGNTQI